MDKGRFKKGMIPWNKGVKTGLVPKTAFKKGEHFSKATEFKVGRKKDQCWNWKGDNAGYSALHYWVRREKGLPQECEHCDSKNNLQWANVSFEYKRDVNDWMSLCYKCHRKYDMQYGWGEATKRFNGL